VADFKPAHVDDLRVFDLLDWITHRPKDNWIIPFESAVDFLKKLEKWLAVADSSMVPPLTSEARGRNPITVIVEGRTDADVVKAIAGRLALNRPLSVVVAEGKRAILGNLKVYTRAFKNSAAVVVLADADTSDVTEIEIQKAQFQRIIQESERRDTRLVLAVPEIEAWLGKTDFRRGRIRHYNKLFEELHDLETKLDEHVRANPSLKEFIEVLRTFDREPENTLNPEP
jgi:hypothetical protein